MKYPEIQYIEAVELLKKMIQTPSFSKEENITADIIQIFLENKRIKTHRKQNNVWAYNLFYDETLPTILLNSHHDTVKPNSSWTLDPFEAKVANDQLFGLGSNDAGASLVSLISTFCFFYEQKNLKYNILLVASAEEEISGKNGIDLLIQEKDLPAIDFAIVGEPTEMNLAIAEKGLMVLDCIARGKAGHAAREEGENAITKAMKDIEWFNTFRFPRKSTTLGEMKMSVTLINAGKQHNVVPDTCVFTVDCRITEQYSLEETLQIVRQHVSSEVQPRSMRLKSSSIDMSHPIVQAGMKLGKSTYGSPTMSDQALLNCSSLKMGPGKSERSHTADEFILLSEIEQAIGQYIEMLMFVIY